MGGIWSWETWKFNLLKFDQLMPLSIKNGSGTNIDPCCAFWQHHDLLSSRKEAEKSKYSEGQRILCFVVWHRHKQQSESSWEINRKCTKTDITTLYLTCSINSFFRTGSPLPLMHLEVQQQFTSCQIMNHCQSALCSKWGSVANSKSNVHCTTVSGDIINHDCLVYSPGETRECH